MTMPEGEGSSRGPDPVPGSQRTKGWVTILAWGVAVVAVFVLGGLAAFIFQTSQTYRQELGSRFKAAVVDRPDPSRRIETHEIRNVPAVTPLPGLPPILSPSADQGDGARVIVNPTWAVRPVADFPMQAQRMGVETGAVDLQCPVAASGRIQSCWIVSETPTGAGFGQAALASAIGASLVPRTVDGVAVAGMVRFSVRFKLQ